MYCSRKRYWGQYMWGRRYFCGTVGEVKQRMIEEYRKAGKRRWVRQFFDGEE
ncbi:MAG: transposase [Bacteroides cellulosilyticus]